MTDDLAIYISGGTALAALGIVAGVTWQVSRIEKSMRDDFQREIGRLEHDARSRGDTYRNEFGETCAAIRQKLHDVEVFTRDNFVNKDSFQAVVERLERSFDKVTERLESKLDQALNLIHKRTD